jgi:chromosome segregation ATPase
LNEELRKQKEQLRKLQARYRDEEKNMKHQHEQLVMLEERCRKMVTLIKEKKKERQKIREDIDTTNNGGGGNANGGQKYTQEELEKLQY